MADTSPNPRGPTPPSYDPDLGELGYRAPRSLVEDLGEVADDLRQVAVDIGARPYTVHAVRVRWTGGELGRGDSSVVSDVALQPSPVVGAVGGMDRALGAAGAVERGDVVLTGISPRYTEDELANYLAAGVESQESYWEIRIDERDGSTTRRRYTLAKPPERRPTRFDWRLTLRRQDGDRSRTGAPRATRPQVWR